MTALAAEVGRTAKEKASGAKARQVRCLFGRAEQAAEKV